MKIRKFIFSQILMSEVDFFVRKNTAKKSLELEEEEGIYPPRFHVILSCTPNANQSQTKIEFKGAVSDMVFDILLTPAVTYLPLPGSK